MAAGILALEAYVCDERDKRLVEKERLRCEEEAGGEGRLLYHPTEDEREKVGEERGANRTSLSLSLSLSLSAERTRNNGREYKIKGEGLCTLFP